jgi:TPP-dependent 2-oxoacid decarboxylase
MIRFGATPVILLMNNKGYTIEIEIHDGKALLSALLATASAAATVAF